VKTAGVVSPALSKNIPNPECQNPGVSIAKIGKFEI
jgi:hypothetical protein